MESTVLVKALALLESLAGIPDGRSLGDLAGEVGATKPTTHRILKTLTKLGYVEHSAGGVYRQTTRVRRLITPADLRLLLAASEPVLRRLHQQTGETVNLGVLRHGHVRYVQVWESLRPLRRVVTADSVDPFYCTSLGRAIVAYLPDPQRQHLLQNMPIKPTTPHTVIDRAQLQNLLAETRGLGYAIEIDQTDVGVTCVGAPIFDVEGPAAAVSLSIPTARAGEMERAPLISAVLEAAREASLSLQQLITSQNSA